MINEEKCYGCSSLNNFTTCNDQTNTASTDTEIVMDTNAIQITDQILLVRQNSTETRVYKAPLSDLSPQVSLLILSKVVQVMPKVDPMDGQSLWNNNGYICIANDPVANAFS